MQQAPGATRAATSNLGHATEHGEHDEHPGEQQPGFDGPGQNCVEHGSGGVAADRRSFGFAGERDRRSRIERLPSGLGEPHLDPCVRIARLDGEHTGDPISFAGDVAGRETSGNTLRAEHHDER